MLDKAYNRDLVDSTIHLPEKLIETRATSAKFTLRAISQLEACCQLDTDHTRIASVLVLVLEKTTNATFPNVEINSTSCGIDLLIVCGTGILILLVSLLLVSVPVMMMAFVFCDNALENNGFLSLHFFRCVL